MAHMLKTGKNEAAGKLIHYASHIFDSHYAIRRQSNKKLIWFFIGNMVTGTLYMDASTVGDRQHNRTQRFCLSMAEDTVGN